MRGFFERGFLSCQSLLLHVQFMNIFKPVRFLPVCATCDILNVNFEHGECSPRLWAFVASYTLLLGSPLS